MIPTTIERASACEAMPAVEARRRNEIRSGESAPAEQTDRRSTRLLVLGQETARIAHDLNGPATLVQVGLEALEQHALVLVDHARASSGASAVGSADPGSNADVEQAIAQLPGLVTICRDGARHLRDLVDQLLTFVRGTGPTESARPLDVALILREAISSVLGGRGGEPGVRVHEAIAGPDLVDGHAPALHRAFSNLVANALDATRGQVDRELSITLRGCTIAGSGEGSGPWVEIRIADNGRGIPSEDLDRVFEAFFTTKREGGGLGLGLTIAREAVLAHGGTIEACARGPVGTEFVVRLPAAPNRGL